MSLPNLNPSRVRLGAWLLIAGFIVFIVGPVSLFLFPEMRSTLPNWDFRAVTSPAQMIQAVIPYRAPWVTANILLFISPALTAIGLIVLTGVLRDTHSRQLATVGLIGIVAATAVWLFHLYLLLGLALGDPQRPSELLPLVGISSLTYQTQAVFELLTVVSGIIYSVCLWRSGILKRMGVVASILFSLLLIVAIVMGGMPPIIPYFVTMLIGIGLLLRRQ